MGLGDVLRVSCNVLRHSIKVVTYYVTLGDVIRGIGVQGDVIRVVESLPLHVPGLLCKFHQ